MWNTCFKLTLLRYKCILRLLIYAEFLRNMLAICIISNYYVHYRASYMCDAAVRFESQVSHICDIVDYPYVCFIYVQVNMCDILCKRKACCKKAMDHSEGFSNLTVVANVLMKVPKFKSNFHSINKKVKNVKMREFRMSQEMGCNMKYG